MYCTFFIAFYLFVYERKCEEYIIYVLDLETSNYICELSIVT